MMLVMCSYLVVVALHEPPLGFVLLFSSKTKPASLLVFCPSLCFRQVPIVKIKHIDSIISVTSVRVL